MWMSRKQQTCDQLEKVYSVHTNSNIKRLLYPKKRRQEEKKQVFERQTKLSLLHDQTSGAHCATPGSLSRDCLVTSISIYRLRIAGLVNDKL